MCCSLLFVACLWLSLDVVCSGLSMVVVVCACLVFDVRSSLRLLCCWCWSLGSRRWMVVDCCLVCYGCVLPSLCDTFLF